MRVIDLAVLGLILALAGLVISAMVVNFRLGARIGRLKERGELRGYRFRMFKFVPQTLSFEWGFTPWDLGPLIDQIRGDARYREELKLARWLVALYVAFPVLGLVWFLCI